VGGPSGKPQGTFFKEAPGIKKKDGAKEKKQRVRESDRKESSERKKKKKKKKKRDLPMVDVDVMAQKSHRRNWE